MGQLSRYIGIATGYSAFIVSLCSRAALADSYGNPVQFEGESGAPRFSIHYFYEPTNVAWVLTATIKTSSIPAKRPLFVRVLNPKSGEFASEWLDVGLTTVPSRADSFTIALDRASSLRTLKAFPDVVLVFSVNKNKIDANLNLKAVCSNFPEHFVDHTSVRTGCRPDAATLESIPEQTGGKCSKDLHETFCSSSFDAVRDAIAKQHQCVFQCK